MSIALMQQRREMNKRKLAALAALATLADVDEWPERLEALAKKPATLADENMIRSLVLEVVQVVAVEGVLPKVIRPAGRKTPLPDSPRIAEPDASSQHVATGSESGPTSRLSPESSKGASPRPATKERGGLSEEGDESD